MNFKPFLRMILINPVKGIFNSVYMFFYRSKTARVLLLIVLIKFFIFYGFFKSYLFPRHLKPKWDSEQHRIDYVINEIVNDTK